MPDVIPAVQHILKGVNFMELISTALKVGEKVTEAAEKAAELGTKIADTAGELSTRAADGVVNHDGLSVTNDEMDNLLNKAIGVERAERKNDVSFKGVKICASRHGCSGATNCDHAYGAPVGR